MSLAKKIVLISASVVLALVVIGTSIYKLIIVPKYIEPLLDSASEMMKDSDVQDTVTNIAEELTEKGILDGKTFREYVRKSRKYTSMGDYSDYYDEAGESLKSGERINTSSSIDNSDKFEEDDEESEESDVESSLGIAKAMVIEESDTKNAKVNERYSNRFNENNYSDVELGEFDNYTLNDAVEGSKISGSENKSNYKATTLYEKIVGAMSISERSVFFSVIGKADTNKLLSLRNDKQGAKEYLHSILDNEEYSRAVEIFYKYAPLLYED